MKGRYVPFGMIATNAVRGSIVGTHTVGLMIPGAAPLLRILSRRELANNALSSEYTDELLLLVFTLLTIWQADHTA